MKKQLQMGRISGVSKIWLVSYTVKSNSLTVDVGLGFAPYEVFASCWWTLNPVV